MPQTVPQRIIFFGLENQRREDGRVVATYASGNNDRSRDESLVRDYLKVELTHDAATDTRVSGAAIVTTYSCDGNPRSPGFKLKSTTYQLNHDRQAQQTIVTCDGITKPRAARAAQRYLTAARPSLMMDFSPQTVVADALHCAILADLRPTHYIPVEHNGSHAEDIGAAADIQLAALASTVDYLTYPKGHTAS